MDPREHLALLLAALVSALLGAPAYTTVVPQAPAVPEVSITSPVAHVQ